MSLYLLKIISSSLIFTIILELGLALIFKIKNKDDIIIIVLVNVVTNPIVVVFPYLLGIFYGNTGRYVLLLILEILTVFFEGFIYKKYLKFKSINPYVLSILLNVTSYFIGIFINRIIY